MLITTMFIQLSEFNFAHGQPTCKALYMGGPYSVDSVPSQGFLLSWPKYHSVAGIMIKSFLVLGTTSWLAKVKYVNAEKAFHC